MCGKVSLIRLCVAMLAAGGGAGCRVSAQVSPGAASKIMGDCFLGVEEVGKHFGIKLTEEELAKVREVPFSERTLLQCKDSHILFLCVRRGRSGKALTIERLREMFPAGGQPRFRSYPKPTATGQSYATKDTPQLRWYLISRRLREESRSKPYWQQELFLGENEYRERAVVYVYMMLLMYKARGELLFQKDLVWCNNTGSDGAPVAAGYFGPEGLYVSDWWLRRDVHFGMAPARKPDFH
jgi:hypothetical protein